MSEKGNRTIALVGLLSDKEKKLFSSQLNGGKRASLSLMFNSIWLGLKSSKPDLLEKKSLFKRTFGSGYTRDKDYLLRNELRLLSQELTRFLSLEQIKKSMRDNPLEEKRLLLQSYLDRNAFDLFDKEWRKILVEAQGQKALGTALEIQKMTIDHMVQRQQATIENYHQLLALLSDYQETLNKTFLHRHLFGKHKQAFTERTLQALGDPLDISPLVAVRFDPTNTEQNDAYTNHFVALTRSYAQNGKGKIKLLQDALAFAEEIDSREFDKRASLASINAGIALEYFLMREFETSLPFHRSALGLGAKLDDGKLISFVFNYLSTLIRLEQYDKAIGLIKDYRTVWEKLPRMCDRFLCLKAMCHVFENDPKSAEDCIPDDRKSSGIDHYYYYRFIQIIVLHQKGKPELALNEAENFEQTVRYNDKNEDYLRLIQAMKKFLTLKSEKPIISEKAYTEKSEKLKRTLNETSESALADRALLYRWIIKGLE